jgi:hypothetical protein
MNARRIFDKITMQREAKASTCSFAKGIFWITRKVKSTVPALVLRLLRISL